MTVMPEDRLPQGDEKRAAVRAMFDTIAPRYDLVNRLMTFRMDQRWRRTTLERMALPPGSTVLDLACGTGDFCVELGQICLNLLQLLGRLGQLLRETLAAVRGSLAETEKGVVHVPTDHGTARLDELPVQGDESNATHELAGRIQILDHDRVAKDVPECVPVLLVE